MKPMKFQITIIVVYFRLQLFKYYEHYNTQDSVYAQIASIDNNLGPVKLRLFHLNFE